MKRLFKLARNIFFTDTPIYVIFFVTGRCNARCKMCFNWKRTEQADRVSELTLEEIRKTFRNFGYIQQLTISGGEPFLREDLPEILGFISAQNDVGMITIPTNGILSERIALQIKNILHRIKKTTQLRVLLSLEGIAEEHDRIVQVPRAFQKIEETYRRLRPLSILQRNFSTVFRLEKAGHSRSGEGGRTIWSPQRTRQVSP